MPRKALPVAKPKRAPRAAKAAPAKVGIISLGCPKNLVDTETLLGKIALEHVVCADPADADVVLVNTCGFIDQARDESLSVIREVAGWKAAGKIQGLVVTGCLAQRWGEKLHEEVGGEESGGIDAVVGMSEYDRIETVLRGVMEARKAAERAQAPWRTLVAEDPSYPVPTQTGRLRVTPPHYAYLQLSEGCDNACTFCSIPSFRGLFRSKTREAILAEARELVDAGAVELNLISQDTTDWGKDLEGRPGLESILQELSALDGLRWIRLLYAYPGHVSDALIQEIATNPKVVKYIDMPIQHISTPVLKRMGRRHTREQTRELLLKLRAEVPGIVLRTTFISGFPGETKAQHEELVEFVKEFRFERLGAFPYSHEPGTPAGERFQDDVPAATKRKRVDELMAAQQEVAFAHAAAQVGHTLEVLVEGPDETGQLVGRTAGDAPEIDPCLTLTLPRGAKKPPAGKLVKAKVTATRDYDLVGEMVRGPERRVSAATRDT